MTGVMSQPSQPKRELLLSKYIIQILDTFGTIFTNKDLEVPAEVVRATTRFMCEASGICKNEDTRRSAIHPKLLNVLSVGMEKIVNLDST